MKIYDIDQLDPLADDQLWEATANNHNAARIHQRAILRWLYPDETLPDTVSNDLGGGRFLELRQRATVLDSDEIEENEVEDVEGLAPYFESEGRLILGHDGVSYLIGSLDEAHTMALAAKTMCIRRTTKRIWIATFNGTTAIISVGGTQFHEKAHRFRPGWHACRK